VILPFWLVCSQTSPTPSCGTKDSELKLNLEVIAPVVGAKSLSSLWVWWNRTMQHEICGGTGNNQGTGYGWSLAAQ
jgi:hypothetical protein